MMQSDSHNFFPLLLSSYIEPLHFPSFAWQACLKFCLSFPFFILIMCCHQPPLAEGGGSVNWLCPQGLRSPDWEGWLPHQCQAPIKSRALSKCGSGGGGGAVEEGNEVIFLLTHVRVRTKVC